MINFLLVMCIERINQPDTPTGNALRPQVPNYYVLPDGHGRPQYRRLTWKHCKSAASVDLALQAVRCMRCVGVSPRMSSCRSRLFV